MGVITFNGKSSSDYGILVEHPPGYHIPTRDYEYIHVPGRNGDLIIDKGSYQNSIREYEIALAEPTGSREFIAHVNNFSKWLNSASGYARLEDSYEPGYYRMASYVDEIDIENILFHAGRATISFNCKPQRYLTIGDIVIQGTAVSDLSTFGNSYRCQGTVHTSANVQASCPYIKVSGNGNFTLYFQSQPVMIVTGMTDYVEIDCDLKDVYKGTTSMNANARLVDNKPFPTLTPNANSGFVVTVVPRSSGTTLTGLELTPRWWTL